MSPRAFIMVIQPCTDVDLNMPVSDIVGAKVLKSKPTQSVCFRSSNPWKGGRADCGGSGDDWLAFMRLLGHVIALGIPKRKVV